MRKIQFDWRWVVAIAVLVVLASGGSLPWPVRVLALGGSGGYLLWLGWQAWVRSGGAPTRSRVTYWRGQRYEVAPPRRGPALPRWNDIGAAVPYLLFGGILVLVALTIALRALGV